MLKTESFDSVCPAISSPGMTEFPVICLQRKHFPASSKNLCRLSLKEGLRGTSPSSLSIGDVVIPEPAEILYPGLLDLFNYGLIRVFDK